MYDILHVVQMSCKRAKIKKSTIDNQIVDFLKRDPGETRTPNLLIRSQNYTLIIIFE